MAYTDLVNIKKRLPAHIIEQLTDDHGTGSVVTEIVDDAIATAQEEIDGYLKGRYPDDIADDDVPAMITDIATSLSVYNLYARKIELTMPDSIQLKYKNAIKQLERIQAGKISPFPEANEPTVIRSNKTVDSKTYDSDLWATYD